MPFEDFFNYSSIVTIPYHQLAIGNREDFVFYAGQPQNPAGD